MLTARGRKNRTQPALGYLLRNDVKRHKALFLMCIPGLIWFAVFKYAPMYGALVAFKNYSVFRGFFASPWVGFRYFEQFISDFYFWRLLRNTLLLGVYCILWSFPAPILLALAINEVRNRQFKKLTQTVTYIPYFISVVIIVGILKNMLASDGVVNILLKQLGMEPIIFLNDPKWFRTLYVSSDIWASVGYNSIIYLAAITGIDPELYEAARIDGASRVQNILHITLPSILSTILVLFILRIGAVINVGFEKVYLLYSPATYETADVISTYVYRRAMIENNVSYAAAVDLFNSAVAMVMLLSANKISRRFFGQGVW